MTSLEKKQYHNALKIIEAYPEALLIVERYGHSLKTKTDKVLVNKPNIVLEKGYINLGELIPARARNVLTAYFYDYFGTTIKLEKFPTELLLQIDLTKLRSYINCGENTYESIYNVVQYYKLNPK